MAQQADIVSHLNKRHIAPAFIQHEEKILEVIRHFDHLGYKVGKGRRNMVKHIKTDELDLNVKSFQLPNKINRVVYRFFRKSKARRSFEYAQHLLATGIGTPQPVAYFEERKALSFGRSFFVSLQLDEDLTFRTLIDEPDYPGREEIIRQFTRFTHKMHEEGILFLDHSPGNTLIKKEKEGGYRFYLVDLNRMRHRQNLGFKARMKNFARLTATDDIIAIISEEYANITNYNAASVYDCITRHTAANQKRRRRQKRINRKLGKYPGRNA